MNIELISKSESTPFFLNQTLEEIKNIISSKLIEQDSDEDVPNSKYYYSRDLDIKFLFDADNKLVSLECFSKPIFEREIFVDGIKVDFSKENLIELQKKGHTLKHYNGGGYKIDSLNLIFSIKEFDGQTVSVHYSNNIYFEDYDMFPYKEVTL